MGIANSSASLQGGHGLKNSSRHNVIPLCVACGAAIGNGGVSMRVPGGRLLACGECSSWTWLPRPSQEAQSALHDSADYFDHPYFQARREDERLFAERCERVFSLLGRYINLELLKGRRLLDIGCDTGSFMYAAQQSYAVLPMGIDVARRPVEIARERGLAAFHGSLEAAPEEFSGADVVTAIDVLEHVPDPRQFLSEIQRRMSPGAVLYMQTPNFSSFVYMLGRMINRVTGGRPRALMERLFPPQHIQYFSAEGLKQLAKSCGLETVFTGTRILPASDIVASALVRGALMAVQLLDALAARQILLVGVFRKPS